MKLSNSDLLHVLNYGIVTNNKNILESAPPSKSNKVVLKEIEFNWKDSYYSITEKDVPTSAKYFGYDILYILSKLRKMDEKGEVRLHTYK